jgi:hypothetical protein
MLRSGGAGWKSALDLSSDKLGGCSLAGYLTLTVEVLILTMNCQCYTIQQN